jgi:hypothetical protein
MNLESLADKLKKSSLMSCTIDSSNFSFTLEFSLGGGETDIIIKLYQIIHSSISKDPDEQESCFFVGDFSVTPLSDGGHDVLSYLKHSFRDPNGEVSSYPSRPLWHLHVEGGICLDFVFGAYEIFQAVDGGY